MYAFRDETTMNILYVTTIGLTMIFFKNLTKELIDEGHTVDIACNETEEKVPDCYREWGCKIYPLSCSRALFRKGNIDAINQLKKIVKENHYDIVHCHTPIASICTRLACYKLRRNGTKVFYTAHGFHFYKGAPLINWLIYYPIEKFASRLTDELIVINHEDFDLANRRMRAKHVVYVPGVGVDVNRFQSVVVDRLSKRRTLGIPEDAFLLISVGELNRNKNHEVVVRAIAQLGNKNIHYMIAGRGPLKEYLLNLASDLGVSSQVHLLGYREDIAELYKSSDVCCFPSIREGLPLAAIEAMACGLPIIVADNRGTREFAANGVNGFVCKWNDIDSFANSIMHLANNRNILEGLSIAARDTVRRFDESRMIPLMKDIYNKY